MARFTCFGELLLRLGAPGREVLLQTPTLTVHVGGAEANVALALAQFGHQAGMVSTLPSNALGAAALRELGQFGVDTTGIRLAPGRMGLYFLETGAVRRPSRIIYDRARSAFTEADPAGYDWPSLLAGTGLLHLSGVTPATGANGSAAAIAAAEAAADFGLPVSFDGNYRSQLWQAWGGDGPAVLKRILSAATLAFVNERDLSLILGQDFPDRESAFRAAFEFFPRLDRIAATHRQQVSADHHILDGELVTRDSRFVSGTHDLPGIVDRIGGGDAFAAGLLHAIAAGQSLQRAIEFATAAGAYKHSVPGDFMIASVADIEDMFGNGNLDVRR